MTTFLLALLVAAAPSAAPSTAPTTAPSTGPTMSPASPLPSADPAMTDRAKAILHQAQTAQFDRSQLDDKMNAALTDEIAKKLASQLSPLGDPTAFTLLMFASQEGYDIYLYKVAFKTVTLDEQIVIDPKTGKIAGIQFKPAQ